MHTPIDRAPSAGWDPDVVVERVQGLGRWLSCICEKLQFVSPELMSFLNVPMYFGIRMLSGDLQPDDFVEPCSPDSVMADDEPREASPPQRLRKPIDFAKRSPDANDQRSLSVLAGSLPHSVTRPGYNESALFVARAICAHSAAAGLAAAPPLEEAVRFVRAVCGRALFKPCSLIAAVVYNGRRCQLSIPPECDAGKGQPPAARST